MAQIRIVQNPISNKLLVMIDSGDIRDLARKAAEVSQDAAEAGMKVMFDTGTVEFTPEDLKGTKLTAADVWDKITDIRGGKHSMFDSSEGQNGTVEARFNSNAPATVSLYYAALDAVMLSREEKAPVEFEFRNRTVTVTGATDPVEIEQSFPANLRTRGDYVPPPRQWRSVKDMFNIASGEDGVITAVYKDPEQAQKHLWYISYDLTDLSHEFGGAAVRYQHGPHMLTVTEKDTTDDVAARVPEKDIWLKNARL